jgi:MazG family protein
MDSETKSTAGAEFDRLVSIMARLRGPEGCPWDREQTFDTLKSYLLEEAYEVMEAIDSRDFPELAEELGDLLLQPVFLAQMASEAGHFEIRDSVAAINAKLIRRHPHIFGDAEAHDADAVKKRWAEIKKEEKAAKNKPEGHLLDSVSRVAPALVEANQISVRAAATGFDWENAEQVLAKLDEERAEFEQARRAASQDDMEHEIGDLLFVIVNLARFHKVDPEQALRKTNARFRSRFAHVEDGLKATGTGFESATLEQMESLWQQAKVQEHKRQEATKHPE